MPLRHKDDSKSAPASAQHEAGQAIKVDLTAAEPAPATKKGTHLLALPMELLVLIAKATDVHTDILSLRLTCRTLAGAAADAFAEEYVEDLSCFMLDTARLSRIKNITSTPHLAAKIRELEFTCRAFEQRQTHEIPIVPRKDETMDDAQWEYVYSIADGEKASQIAILTQPKSANLELMEDILKDLKGLQKCSIEIDSGTMFSKKLPDYSITLPASCLELVQRHNLPLELLCFTNRCDFSHELLQSRLPSTTTALAHKLFHFTYFAWFETLEDLTSAAALKHFTVINGIMAGARLVSLDFSLNTTAGLRREQAFLNLPSMLIPSAGLSTVKWISLRNMRLSLAEMLRLMASCKRLQGLHLDDILVLHHHFHPWKEIFARMRDLSMLKQVGFTQLGYGRREDGTYWHESFIVKRHYGEGDGVWSDCYSKSTGGKVDAKDFLDWNLGPKE